MVEPDTLDDAELLRRFTRDGADDAFAELVRRYLGLVYHAALRQLGGDAALAEDVAQQVFTRLARRAATLQRHQALAGWLHTTTRFAASENLRAQRRRRVRENEAYLMHELTSAESPAADWERLRPVLDEALGELKPPDREAVLLRFFAGLPFAEIGARLKVGENAARMRVERALDKLRALLARRGLASTSAALAVTLAQHAGLAAPAGLASAVTLAGIASATTAAGPAAVLVHFMTTWKLTMSVAGAALLAVAIGTAVRETRARQNATEALTAARADATRLTEREQQLQQRATAESARPPARSPVPAPETFSPPPTPPARRSLQEALRAGRELTAKHPEARQLWLDGVRADLVQKLAPIHRLLDLTPAQRTAVEEALMKSLAGYVTMDLPGGTVAFEHQPTLTAAAAEAQLQGVLGAELAARLQELRRSGATFDFAEKLASAVHGSEPLTPAQTSRMIQIFAAAGPNRGADAPDWKAIASAAASVLSPGQLGALASVQQTFDYHAAIRGGAAATSRGPAAPGSAAPLR